MSKKLTKKEIKELAKKEVFVWINSLEIDSLTTEFMSDNELKILTDEINTITNKLLQLKSIDYKEDIVDTALDKLQERDPDYE